MAAVIATAVVVDRTQFYADLLKQATKLRATTDDALANTANIASLVYHSLKREYGEKSVNWVGFYFVRPKAVIEANSIYSNILVLGTFHGQPAVTEIPYTRGVCGSCARSEKIELVTDVHLREDHIACDPNSNSELILPVFAGSNSSSSNSNSRGRFVAELDMDSPVINGFTQQDADGLTPVVELLRDCDWSFVDLPHKAKITDDDIPACSMAHKPHKAQQH